MSGIDKPILGRFLIGVGVSRGLDNIKQLTEGIFKKAGLKLKSKELNGKYESKGRTL